MRLLFLLTAIGALAACSFDREYAATYDVTTGQYGGTVRLTPARVPDRGQPSVAIGVTGERKPVDFKQVVPEISR